MIDKLYYYQGPGRPAADYEVHRIFAAYLSPIVIAMSQDEQDYLIGLQLVYGKEIKVNAFQDYHDVVWERARTEGIAKYMDNIYCSVSNLTDLLMDPRGDLKWQRELAKQKRTRPLYDGLINFPKGFRL